MQRDQGNAQGGRRRLGNERGVVLAVTLMMLLVLTLIGISAISTSTFETSISGNERVGADAFYASEAGIQVGVNQLPDNVAAVPRTTLKEDSYYWSGGPTDEGSPKAIGNLGIHQRAGFDTSWGFKRFQVNATGKAFGASKEIEVQVSYGPFSAGTQYSN